MPEWFNDISDLPVDFAIVAGVLGALLWYIKREVSEMKHEMFPNSGKSMRDAVDRIERKLDSHIEWHITRKEHE